MSTRDLLVYFNNYITRKTRQIREQKATLRFVLIVEPFYPTKSHALIQKKSPTDHWKKIHLLHHWPVKFLKVSYLNL